MNDKTPVFEFIVNKFASLPPVILHVTFSFAVKVVTVVILSDIFIALVAKLFCVIGCVIIGEVTSPLFIAIVKVKLLFILVHPIAFVTVSVPV